jgi:broad specificity phosphatase PhoE
MRVILVRHGETDLNAKGVFRGRADVPLSARGRAQSKAVARALRGIRLDGIYSSPLARANETASAIAARRGVHVATAVEFIDMDFGQWQGLTVAQATERYPAESRAWVLRPGEVRVPGGETLEGVRQRAAAGLNRLLEAHPEGTIVIVSHGVVNKLTLCTVLGLTAAGFWNVKQDTGAISIFELSQRGAKLFLMNDTCHLGRISDVVEGMAGSTTPIGVSTDDERRYTQWRN